MRDDWDVYFTHMDGKPASILLDLGFGPEAPIPGLSIMCYVTVGVLDPDERGMSKSGENERLLQIEKALVSALAGETCVFVGQCATGGERDFFFYMDNGKGVEETVESVMAGFEEYPWDMGLVEEPGWDTYLEFLFPDEQGMDAIWNNRMRRQLAENGDDPSVPRRVDHRLSFASEHDRLAFKLEAEAENFTVAPLDAGEDKPFGALAWRVDAPDDIDDVTWPLRELAGAHGGTYEGWTCEVAK